MSETTCAVTDCREPVYVKVRGLCQLHYRRLMKKGSVGTSYSQFSEEYRKDTYWSRVDKSGPIIREDLGPCWVWMGGRFDTEYGAFYWHGNNVGAHRLSMEFHHGIKLTKEDVVCHKCDNPPCVNPEHLFIGSAKDNIHDMINKDRRVNYYSLQTSCRRGHPYTEGSYWIRIRNGRESRVCKECDRLRGIKRRSKNNSR